jgi:hypothetical protein
MRSLTWAKRFYHDRVRTRRMNRRFSEVLRQSIGEAVPGSRAAHSQACFTARTVMSTS